MQSVVLKLADPDTDNTLLLLWELHERLRAYEAQIFIQGERAMMIEQLKVKLGSFFDKAYAANNGRTYVQKVIVAVKTLTLSKLDSVKTQMEGFFENDRFDASVDFLVDFAKGNLGNVVPWYMRLFMPSTNMLVGDLGVWLKANKAMFKEQIGSANPMIDN